MKFEYILVYGNRSDMFHIGSWWDSGHVYGMPNCLRIDFYIIIFETSFDVDISQGEVII